MNVKSRVTMLQLLAAAWAELLAESMNVHPETWSYLLLQVFIKILEVTDDGTGRIKVGASMKVCDQETGTDLDPNNLAGSRCSAKTSPSKDLLLADSSAR